MQFFLLRRNYSYFSLFLLIGVFNPIISFQENIKTANSEFVENDILINGDYFTLSQEDLATIAQHNEVSRVYLSDNFISSLRVLRDELLNKISSFALSPSLEEINILLRQSRRIVSQATAEQAVRDINELLKEHKSKLSQENFNFINISAQKYLEDINSSAASIFIDDDSNDLGVKRRRKAVCNLLVRDCLKVGGALYVCGNERIKGQLIADGASTFNAPVTINFPQRRRAGIDALTVIGVADFTREFNLARIIQWDRKFNTKWIYNK